MLDFIIEVHSVTYYVYNWSPYKDYNLYMASPARPHAPPLEHRISLAGRSVVIKLLWSSHLLCLRICSIAARKNDALRDPSLITLDP